MNALLWGQGGDCSIGVTVMGLSNNEHTLSLVRAVLRAGRGVQGQRSVTSGWKRSPGREKNALETLAPPTGEQ